MSNLEYKIEYATENFIDESAVPVIIVAAGSANRMSGINKIFANVCNIPVIVHTLRAFERSNFISRIIIVTKQDDILNMQNIAEKYCITKVSDIVSGGECRQDSVKNGMLRLDNDDMSVIIHDGARPIINQTIIENIVLALKEHKSVACAVKSKDTVKRVDEKGFVIETLNRDELVCVQTPQGVRVEDYLRAISGVKLSEFTDDTSIMESIGVKTLIVPGDYHNIKITTPEDLVIAQNYLDGDDE